MVKAIAMGGNRPVKYEGYGGISTGGGTGCCTDGDGGTAIITPIDIAT